MERMFTRNAGPKALVTVIQALVDFKRSGSFQLGLLELSPGVNGEHLIGYFDSGESVLDILQEVIDDYSKTIPTIVPRKRSAA